MMPIDRSEGGTDEYDEFIARSASMEAAVAPQADVSHPAIFRKGTLIDIPDNPQRSSHRRRESRLPGATLKPRLVAIGIKDDSQAKPIIDWALQNELVLGRDRIVLLHVRQAANGMISDLTSMNRAKEVTEREKSHELLRRHAGVIKHEGFGIKGVSIRGVDVRGEMVRKLVELKCDLVIVGSRSTKSIKERFIGCKAPYWTANAPCPVLVVNSSSLLRYSQESAPKEVVSPTPESNQLATSQGGFP
ncbi:hypothetical protein IWW39_004676 [Coemansia spiralis]|uniref:UspA domain-containing protein n=1 Tax=Coemansia spiralis TaxID=417178 RepID=A0A9W8L1F2_9FUNG|nr:hypothetical protein IWW39_004676 [Coemansia spiralis]